jgi:PAS domain-containing protein
MTETDYNKMDKAELVDQVKRLRQQLDVLEKSEGLEEIIDSELKYRALVEGSTDFIYILDQEGRFTFAKHRASNYCLFLGSAV